MGIKKAEQTRKVTIFHQDTSGKDRPGGHSEALVQGRLKATTGGRRYSENEESKD